MLVSFFDSWTFVTWADYQFKKGFPEIPYIASIPEVAEVLGKDWEIITPYQPAVDEIPGQPKIPDQGRLDCIGVYKIDFDPTTQTVWLEWTEVIIDDLPPVPETPQEKKARIWNALILSETLDDFDLEWQEFSDMEIGDLITARVFGNNPHAEKALTNKVLSVAIWLLQGNEMTEVMGEKIEQATTKKAEVDAVRNLFNLWKL